MQYGSSYGVPNLKNKWKKWLAVSLLCQTKPLLSNMRNKMWETQTCWKLQRPSWMSHKHKWLKENLNHNWKNMQTNSRFYIAITENPKTNVYYKKWWFSPNSVNNIMNRIIYNRPLATSKKKLKKLRVARQSIIQ